MIAMAPVAFLFPEAGLRLVKQHFGEPLSTYPAPTVAMFLAAIGGISALVAFYLLALSRVLGEATTAPVGPTFPNKNWQTMAWSMAAMHVALIPLAHLALVVETAFKGPGSDVTISYGPFALLGLFTAFALASRDDVPELAGEQP